MGKPKISVSIEFINVGQTIKEQIKDILNKPIDGHPSRHLEEEIHNIKQAILLLAKNLNK